MLTGRSQRQAATIAEDDQLAGLAEEQAVELDNLANAFDHTLPGGCGVVRDAPIEAPEIATTSRSATP